MKKIVGIVLLNIIVLIIYFLLNSFCIRNEYSTNIKLVVCFEEKDNNTIEQGQLFYANEIKDFTNALSISVDYDNPILEFDISDIDFKENILRIDPYNVKEDFLILNVELHCNGKKWVTISGKELKKEYIYKYKGIKAKIDGEALDCSAKNSDPYIIFNKDFSNLIDNLYRRYSIIKYISNIIIIVLVLIELFYLRNISLESVERNRKKIWNVFTVLLLLILAVGVTMNYAVFYFKNHFGEVPLGQLLYHIHTHLDGTDISSNRTALITAIIIFVVVLILAIILHIICKKREFEIGFFGGMIMIAGIFVINAGINAYYHFDVKSYYKYIHESSKLYENYYIDGKGVDFNFSNNKRNLIYIFLESMELTYADVESGGAMHENYISELTKLALENECFSGDNLLNGPHHVMGATYTMGGLSAQTSGTPINENLLGTEILNLTWESDNNYLPGVWTIGDVLNAQGYNQELLIGSVGDFAGRASFFRGHGNYMINDYDEAIKEGRIASDYKVWWGYEDKKLFEFAKEDLLKLSSAGQPFNLTLLTADTHFTDGYVCDLCNNEFDLQYSNVIACSSKQTNDFIDWVKKQDFYDNTTIVICGDHLTMDSMYIDEQNASSFDRRTYMTIINSVVEKENNNMNRVYTTLDMYPTTLAAMGVEFDGDRLGLGVNLYSNTPTLAEELGLDALNIELMKNSKYYTSELLYK